MCAADRVCLGHFNLIVDIIYTFIDPRMKTMYESSKSGFFRFKKRGEKKAA